VPDDPKPLVFCPKKCLALDFLSPERSFFPVNKRLPTSSTSPKPSALRIPRDSSRPRNRYARDRKTMVFKGLGSRTMP
jgi:hypothetical protein